MKNFNCYCSQWKIGSKTCLCFCFFLRLQLICLQNYQLNFLHQNLNGLFCLCVRVFDKYVPKYVPCILILRLKMAKNRFVVYFLRIGDGDSEKHTEFSTLFQSPDESIMLRIVKITSEIDVCQKP